MDEIKKERDAIMATTAHPPVIINHYLSEKIPKLLPEYFSGATTTFPIMSVTPRDITAYRELWDADPSIAVDSFALYERMFRMRRNAFPHIKTEQLLYYFYVNNTTTAADTLFDISQTVQDLLDRGDESAEEINEWTRSKLDTNSKLFFGEGSFAKEFKPIYFHNIKIYQLEETRDVIDFASVKTYIGNKIIIDYTYHIPSDFNQDTTPS